MFFILDLMLYVVLSSCILNVMLMAMTAEEGDCSSHIKNHGGERVRLCASHNFLVVFLIAFIVQCLWQLLGTMEKKWVALGQTPEGSIRKRMHGWVNNFVVYGNVQGMNWWTPWNFSYDERRQTDRERNDNDDNDSGVLTSRGHQHDPWHWTIITTHSS